MLRANCSAISTLRGKPVLYLRATVQAVQALNLARTDALAIVERLGGQMD